MAVDELAGDNRLLKSPPDRAPAWEVCAEFLDFPAPTETALIGVTFTHTPDQVVTRYTEHLPALPSDIWIIDVGGDTRSAADPAVPTATRTDASVTVSTVEHPANLTDLGVTLTECFGDIAPREDQIDAWMDFRSVSALLQHADVETAYKFLEVLTGHVSTHDITAYYHLTPAAHDDRTVHRLALLFDATIELSADGTLSNSNR